MSIREFIHDIVLQVAVLVALFAIMSAITSWNCARCDAALARTNSPAPSLCPLCGEANNVLAAKRAQIGTEVFQEAAK